MIFFHLDMITLGNLRPVNTPMHRQVDSLYEYRMLRTHAAETLMNLDIARCTHNFPLHQLYRAFCHPRCQTCPDFGPFLYIPTLSRVCLQCVLRHSRYRVATLHDVSVCYGLPEDRWDLPVVSCVDLLEGQYSSDRLIDVTQAGLLFRQHWRRRFGSSSREIGSALQEWTYWLRLDTCHARLRSTVAFPCWDPHARIAEPGVCLERGVPGEQGGGSRVPGPGSSTALFDVSARGAEA
ncbi:uncharacterized protein BO72DRAFT_44464 [Aspergillus fijiensis CBS 313.89]|uniref:Uncharacterized protein n=1 Tax=Aspergillus fijiensis CBS 313.89 TaxID=1448319 RepID=A0A8G1RVE6_9EURO|nr:uncharacterized protein BO72DRAFT_44464 [Aspergillus fijiensis CBS 313.89]RAK79437.1 hypothetical protein BO72DRAFT_44464 [Aspergillus fijiensis CBS 313.89]